MFAIRRRAFDCAVASTLLDNIIMSIPKSVNLNKTTNARPFVKWAGGKRGLISQLEEQLPTDFDKCENVTYIEPFVGGGAMLFYMLQQYPNIHHAVINDINSDLTTCYRTIRDNTEEQLEILTNLGRINEIKKTINIKLGRLKK